MLGSDGVTLEFSGRSESLPQYIYCDNAVILLLANNQFIVGSHYKIPFSMNFVFSFAKSC